ncbi:phospholipase D family protein [Enterobacter roggenkampii]|uniref:phospholipase D family nuclease n=1 Tax=Enterobacteriaceae TaxID=543 RepID=UPI00115DF3AD|nr:MULTISPECIES: phospholipase D family protein [Enterobacteriaceae]EHE3815465.1 phospholipase D family protein [Shigella sonnei]EJG2190755.1 phospholipase D family protein [Citrobacter freundii]EMC1016710.1 phospholipase D family protein [Enterobacter bugandensis]HAS1070065.1 phospholipase D family protein [Enterobacter cloacae]MBE3289199.1 phospholipase D family protein [Enterobacter cloacae complex sp. P31C]
MTTGIRTLLSTIIVTILLVPLTTSGTELRITSGFSPGKGAINNILTAIDSAHETIDVAAYSFTSKEIALALERARERGVRVRVMADAKDNGGRYSAVTWLQHKGIPVKLNGQYAIQHNKFMVVDSITTQTGSFNYTSSAVKRNAENTIVIWNEPSTARAYQREFERLWEESN